MTFLNYLYVAIIINIKQCIYSVNGGDINCGYQECQNQNITCVNGSICNIYCAQQACLQSTINCTDGYDCNIYLAEYRSSFNSTINGNYATKLKIITSNSNDGNSQLAHSIINCPSNGLCIIQCNNNYHTCELTDIKAEYSNSLSVTCTNLGDVCQDLDIWCPIKGICYIKGDPDTSAMIRMNIYSVQGFDNVTVSGTPSANSIGTMHCQSGYTAKCVIAADDNNECDPSSNQTCDHLPPPPTTTSDINITNTTMITSDILSTFPLSTIITMYPDKHDIGYTAVDIQYIILSFIMVIITSVMIILNIRKFCNNKNKKILWSIKFNAMLQMVSLWISYLFWIIEIIIGSDCVYANCYDSNEYDLYVIVDSINYIFFVFALMSFYSFMVHRLYHAFCGSVYKMNKKCVYFHIFITLFIPIWYSFLIYYDNDIHFYLTFNAIGLILIFIGLLSLIISFNQKLFELLLLQRHEDNNSDLSMQRDQTITLTLITKHALLGTIILSNGILFIFMICILNLLSKESSDSIWIIYEWFLALLMIINLLCIYFGFKMNEKQYNKICGLCHSKTLKVCEFFVDKRIEKSYNILDFSFEKL